MSYFRKIEYCIVPKEAFPVIHNCPGCGRKTRYISTECFRVNANGGKVDVWLIYQCEKCKHTRNISIYERQKVSGIPREEYTRFLKNDQTLAREYAQNPSFFAKNRLEVDWENISYAYVDASSDRQEGDFSMNFKSGDFIVVQNPNGIKLRPEKQASEVLGLTRSRIKKMLNQGEMEIVQEKKQAIMIRFL